MMDSGTVAVGRRPTQTEAPLRGAATVQMPELAIRFILQNSTISATIPGAGNMKELDANVQCSDKGALPQDVASKIESLGIMHEDPRRYYWIPSSEDRSRRRLDPTA